MSQSHKKLNATRNSGSKKMDSNLSFEIQKLSKTPKLSPSTKSKQDVLQKIVYRLMTEVEDLAEIRNALRNVLIEMDEESVALKRTTEIAFEAQGCSVEMKTTDSNKLASSHKRKTRNLSTAQTPHHKKRKFQLDIQTKIKEPSQFQLQLEVTEKETTLAKVPEEETDKSQSKMMENEIETITSPTTVIKEHDGFPPKVVENETNKCQMIIKEEPLDCDEYQPNIMLEKEPDLSTNIKVIHPNFFNLKEPYDHLVETDDSDDYGSLFIPVDIKKETDMISHSSLD